MNEAGTESLVLPVESSIVTGVSVKDPHNVNLNERSVTMKLLN